MPNTDEILNQSKSAYNQWAEIWRKHASIHSAYPDRNMDEYKNIGIGKACLAVATGYSFEENIQTIKENQEYCDIFCVDKSLKDCIKNGIKPNYCLVCDANVDDEKYLDPIKDQCEETVLFVNVCANPKWAEKGNWKDIIFFVNKDVLKSEKEFSALSGCNNFVPAGTNVSNALIVLLNQSDNHNINNFFGYDKILLIGYDYCWDDTSYYAFDRIGGGKYNYMRNAYVRNLVDESCFSSSNLIFSARWLAQYIKVFKINAVQCSSRSILRTNYFSDDLGQSMRYKFRPEDCEKINDMVKSKRALEAKLQSIKSQIRSISKEHYLNFIKDY